MMMKISKLEKIKKKFYSGHNTAYITKQSSKGHGWDLFVDSMRNICETHTGFQPTLNFICKASNYNYFSFF